MDQRLPEPAATDWRELCAELADALDHNRQCLLDDRRLWSHPLADKARAALAQPVADGPAVPESREPASVACEPSDGELLELSQFHCVSITLNNGSAVSPFVEGTDIRSEVLSFARAAISRYGHQPAPPDEGVDRSHISDGYHTFAELYDHRHSLMLALMRAIPKLCWFSQRHADGEMPFGTTEWFIAGVDLPTGAITYHLPSELLSLAQQTGAAELSVGRPWDGHTANDVIERLRAWVASPQPAPPAAGEVAELVAWLRNMANAGLGGLDELNAARAADLLEQRHPAPVPVSERLPSASHVYFEFVISDADYCTQAGGIAPTYAQALSEGQHYLAQYQQDGPHTLELRRVEVLPPGALPLPQGEVE